MKKEEDKITKIAVTGGKGGTGKSTLAVLLANKFIKKNKKVILVDCDIECPNDYLILGERLEKPIQKIYSRFPELDKTKCQKCGKCVKVCKSNAIFQAPKQYPVFLYELCSGCGACWIICPHQAIKAKKGEIGTVYLNQLNKNFYLITGEARPALEETSPVVRETKKIALNFALKIKADIILFDTAAGTHCPVIMALLGSDLAYAVTEPTPMGAYDLKLILDLSQKLEIPVKVILNQADLGNEKLIQNIIKDYQTKIEMRIPYSQKLFQAYIKGQLLNFKL